MHLVTVATSVSRYMPALKMSCSRFDAHLTILGMGTTWEGFHQKARLLYDHMQSIGGDEVVCVLDAYDTLLLAPLSEMRAKFEALEEKAGADKPVLVIGVERPQRLVAPFMHIIFGKCAGHLINAGCYVGRTRTIRELLRHVLRTIGTEDNGDDQISITRYCDAGVVAAVIDETQDVVLNVTNPLRDVSDDPHVQIVENRLTYRRQHMPVILHANGDSFMSGIVKRLGYDMPTVYVTVLHRQLASQAAGKKWYYARIVINRIGHQVALLLAAAIVCLLVYKLRRAST